jgi:hypothetical protein
VRLRWSDVEFDTADPRGAPVHLRRRRVVEIKETKTHASRRMALDRSTLDVLMAQRAEAKTQAEAAGAVSAAAAYVWPQDVASRVPSPRTR